LIQNLFGHEKGAYTGAVGERKGYFETVNGGTIFLDEIAEMPLGTQARLLRVLESGQYIRVGSSKVEKTNVRVIAATNVDVYDAVKAGKFREDLYYRLNTVPLRSRRCATGRKIYSCCFASLLQILLINTAPHPFSWMKRRSRCLSITHGRVMLAN
jgi:hypothetical protein